MCLPETFFLIKYHRERLAEAVFLFAYKSSALLTFRYEVILSVVSLEESYMKFASCHVYNTEIVSLFIILHWVLIDVPEEFDVHIFGVILDRRRHTHATCLLDLLLNSSAVKCYRLLKPV